MFILETFSLPVRKKVCVCVCVCVCVWERERERERKRDWQTEGEPTGLVSESLTVWPSALRLRSPAGNSLSRSNTHSLLCISSKLTDIGGPSYGNNVWSTFVFEGRSKPGNSCGRRKRQHFRDRWFLAVMTAFNVPCCVNACAISKYTLVSILMVSRRRTLVIRVYCIINTATVTMKDTTALHSSKTKSPPLVHFDLWQKAFYGPQNKSLGW